MMQKEQRLLQPSWIFRIGRVWWDSPPWMGAERNSGWAKMSPVRIWAWYGVSSRLGILPRRGAACGAPTSAAGALAEEAGEMVAIRLGICGLWELPTIQFTPGRVES